MATPDYPTTLPGVSQWRFKPAAQVLASAEGGARAARRRSRVPGAIGEAQWTFIETDYATFRTWWRDTLLRGHKKFWIELPSAGGITWHVCQFTGPYRMQSLGYGAFSVSAELEVLERALEPNLRDQTYFFIEDFESGFGAYSSISGNTSIYTVRAGMTDNCMHCGQQYSGAPAVIRRTLSEPVTGNFLSFRWRVTAFGSDDGCVMSFSNGGTAVFAFNPVREGFYDFYRRPKVYIGSISNQYEGAAAQVAEDKIYRCEITYSPTAGGTQYVLIDEASGATIYTYNIPALTLPSVTFDSIAFTMDSGGLTSETDYDDIYLTNV